ncbi:glycosyltransferase family 2 protein [Chlorobaculum sp. 24CR]|uniref:glycosyltransferase family 2 protein n=1 Tax=Chlorobaculum sp. 24CR TaxID=2508878 RepID=UPI00100C1FC7|nr:glycosyltransferase family 2 protein [Chlorobaculum sp. 24CR]RXK88795.1 glycosyltransferase family 2 protein [Chlorobaculum sp. 24CR]
MSGEKTAVIVLNWNGAADTLACLASLAKVRQPEFTAILADNGSTDASVGLVRRAFPEVEILELPRNLGFAGGNNAAFRSLRGRGFNNVVFLNNDTVVDPGFLQPLLDELQKPWVGIAAPKILYMDDPGRIWYAGGVVRPATGLIGHTGIRQPDGPPFDTPKPVGYATGCCLVMRCRDFEAVGGFDERFRMYGEDVDLSMKVRERGLVVMYQPASRLWHRVSASSGGEMNLGKQLRKSGAAMTLFAKHGMFGGLLLYPLLLPFRALLGLLRFQLFRRVASQDQEDFS